MLDRAMCHHQSGDLRQAEALYRAILEQDPAQADALHLLGVIAHQVSQHETAVDLIGRAIALNPRVPDYYSNFGEALRALQKFDDAVAAYHQALALKPEYAEAHYNLGIALQAQAKLTEAIATYRRALALKPDLVEAHYNLGLAFQQQGEVAKAVSAHEQALAVKPDYPEAHNGLGMVLRQQGKRTEAIAAFQQALVLKPDLVEAHNNLGVALQEQGKLSEAISAYEKALALAPDFETHNNLGNGLQAQGRLDEAMTAYHQALALNPGFSIARSNLFMTMHYSPTFDAAALFAEARRWNACHAQPLAAYKRPHKNDRSPERRLRIGYVSADFRRHPVGYFLSPAFTARDKEQFEVFCYSSVVKADDMTKRFADHADHWHDVTHLDDEALAEMIRADGIDILVDLAGHTTRNRLLVFAHKPAPVQVTGGGHYDTTGLDTMDYLLSDRFHTPPGSEQYFSEELVRLPNGYNCYGPPDYAPPVTGAPFFDRGYITFGCFNNLAKVTPEVIRLWARILSTLPDAQLKLQTRGLNDATTRERYRAMFQAHRVNGDRLDLEGATSHPALLVNYGTIDIALDPFPYSGGLTTCEALWMGVPVITLTGHTFAGRHSTSHQCNVGLEEFVTSSPEEYVTVATELANNVERLADLRGTLRSRVASSPLCDAKRYTRDLEAAYRRMWRKWCGAV